MITKYKGHFHVLSAYSFWGVLPIFWALLADIHPLITLLHRVLWSMVLLAAILRLQGRLGPTLKRLRDLSTLRGILLSSVCLGVNWITYIWAIAAGSYVEASMGYFLCPLFTMASGALFCKEHFRRSELLAVCCLVPGIVIPIVLHGQLPGIALLLAGSWSSYTFLRKRLSLQALEGVFLETVLLMVPLTLLGVGMVGWSEILTVSIQASNVLLFVMAGLVTAAPQILLVAGAQRTTLKFVGITQYLAPSLMLLVSVAYFGKSPTKAQEMTLGFVWGGILVFFVGEQTLRMLGRVVSSIPWIGVPRPGKTLA